MNLRTNDEPVCAEKVVRGPVSRELKTPHQRLQIRRRTKNGQIKY
jgi:hypothetical protein